MTTAEMKATVAQSNEIAAALYELERPITLEEILLTELRNAVHDIELRDMFADDAAEHAIGRW